MFSYFFSYLKFTFIIILLICIITVSILFSNFDYGQNLSEYDFHSIVSSYDFIWPIPGYTKISSPFGKRVSPTTGASSYHSGIDLPAPEGTNLYAIDDGIVIFASWGAGGGYTITYQLSSNPSIKVSYCHVSPIMYVVKGDSIAKGTIIGSVGPKNVYGINNNPYKDSNGNPTNGASTGCHLHFSIKLNDEPVNPLNYYDI